MLATKNPEGTAKVPVSNRVLSGTRLVAVVVGVVVGVGVTVGVAATVAVTVTHGVAVVAVQPAIRPMAMTIGTMTFAAAMGRPAAGRVMSLSANPST
jgi:hypothetical protein